MQRFNKICIKKLISISQEVIEPDKEKQTREKLESVLDRYRNKITKNNAIIEETRNKVNILELSIEAAKHDADMHAQVQDR